uniref:Uncharacterized protein n=1 Tax=Rhipicephalus microplus TaxID=6941 RepID=A0A6G5AFN8_RHIMP
MFNVAVSEGKRICYNFCQCCYSFNALSLYIKCMEVYLLQRCLCYDLLLAYVLHFVCTYASYAHFSFMSCLGTIYCNFLSNLFCVELVHLTSSFAPVKQSHYFISSCVTPTVIFSSTMSIRPLFRSWTTFSKC